MTLAPDGAVSGVPTVPGVFDVTVAATDAAGNSTRQLYVLPVGAPVVPPPGLVGWWRGEPTASAAVLDSIDGNNGGFFTGTTAAPPSYTPDGEVGGAFSFDGTVYVQVPDAPGLRPAEMTAEAWVFPTVLSSVHQSVIASGSSTSDNDAWWMGVFNGNARFWSNHEGPGMVMLQSAAAIPLNQWTHLAASFDGDTKVLYVNGAQVAAQSGLGPLIYDPAAIPVTIASDWTSNASSQLFTGLIDEVSLYDRALSPAEVSGIAAAGPAGKGTVARTS